jgi:hypothetical protein
MATISALKVSLMKYQANPSTDFFQTSHLALPWVIYIHPISVDFVATDLQLKHCSRLPCLGELASRLTDGKIYSPRTWEEAKCSLYTNTEFYSEATQSFVLICQRL